MFKGSCDIVVCYVLSVKIVSFIGICHTMFVLQFGNLYHPKLIYLCSFKTSKSNVSGKKENHVPKKSVCDTRQELQ